MNKIKYLLAVLLLACFFDGYAQLPATLPDSVLPSVAGPVGQPQNASSTTLQGVPYMGATNNFYMLSWDVSSPLSGSPCGIAWRRANNSNVTLNKGYLALSNCFDIDVALFHKNTDSIFALVAFYYLGGFAPHGYYYNVYRFTPTGMAAVSTMNLLMTSSTYGGINVAANNHTRTLAITWGMPGAGIYVKAAPFNTLTFGSNVLLPGTNAHRFPDVCINQYATSHVLQVAAVTTAQNLVSAYNVPVSSVLSGLSTGMFTEYTYTGTQLGMPRISCPEQYSDQKWAMVFSENNGTSEMIRAAVKNALWSPSPVAMLVHIDANTSFPDNRPVVAYNSAANMIHVGWITQNAVPGYGYVAQLIDDPNVIPPGPIPGSYMMVDNLPAGSTPVLAFSTESLFSNSTGLQAVYSEFNSFFPGQYCMVYKYKAWSYPYFRQQEANVALLPAAELSVYPNPFIDRLSFKVPLKGDYTFTVTAIDGKLVYSGQQNCVAGQQMELSASAWAPGTYILRVVSAENGLDITRKLVK